MGNYDASIRVHTNVDSSDIRKAEKEVERLAKKLDSVRQRSAKLEALGGTPKQLESVGYDAELLEDQLAAATETLEQLKAVKAPQDVSEGFNKAEKSAKKCFKTVQSGANKSNKSLGSTTKALKNIVLSMVAFQLIARGTEYIASGFKNLVQYSSELNGVFSDLKSETATLKNSLATAFAPIVTQIIPYLTALVSWLNTAMNTMSQFWAALSGKDTYIRAKKQVIDYAKSLDEANKSAKGALASFDEINVLNKNETSNPGGEVTGADAFEEVAVETDFLAGVDLQPLKDSFDKIVEAASPLINDVSEGLSWLLENVLQPLSEWTVDDYLPAFFELLASAMGIFNDALEKLGPVFTWAWENFFGPMLEWKGDALVEWIEFLTGALSDLWYEVLVPFIEWFKENVLPVIEPALVGIADAFNVMLEGIDEALDGLYSALDGLIEFLAGAFTGDWERAFNGLASIVDGAWEAISGTINTILSGLETLINGVVESINKIIDALNGLDIEVPEWMQSKLGTDKIGFDIPYIDKLTLPRLSTDSISASSVLADLEERTRTGVSTIANSEELAYLVEDKSNSEKEPIVINFEGTLAEIGRVLKPVLAKENIRIGNNLLGG